MPAIWLGYGSISAWPVRVRPSGVQLSKVGWGVGLDMLGLAKGRHGMVRTG